MDLLKLHAARSGAKMYARLWRPDSEPWTAPCSFAGSTCLVISACAEGPGDASPSAHHDEPVVEHPSAGRRSVARKGERRGEKAPGRGPSSLPILAMMRLTRPPCTRAVVTPTNVSERPTWSGRPGEAVPRVEDPDVLEHGLGEQVDEVHAGQVHDAAEPAERQERAERVGPASTRTACGSPGRAIPGGRAPRRASWRPRRLRPRRRADAG